MSRGDRQALCDLLGRRPSDIEPDRAALELARIEYPDLDSDRAIRQLDDIAARVADRASDLSDGVSFLNAANAVLFGEMDFRGNHDDYYNPENCCLNRVLETGLGIPITLSVIYLEVARRLAKPVAGIALPGHFIVRYEDGSVSAYVDPFHGGALLDEEGCQLLAQVDTLTPTMLAPVDTRHILMRIVNNLRQMYFERGDAAKALEVIELLIEADPANADEHKQRAVALTQLKRISEAIASFRRYLELAPGAPDRERIEDEIQRLQYWAASKN